VADLDALNARFDRLLAEGVPAKRKRGRNESCWCGSGKKYKRCHWDADRSARALPKMSEILEELIAPILSPQRTPE
jgi:hypothetical protein